MIDKIDRTKLTQDELSQLEQYDANQKQIELLGKAEESLAKISKELTTQGDDNQKVAENFTALLADIHESLDSLDSKESPETPEMPDYAKPVVDTLKGLEKALTAAIKSIDTKPQVNVAAPNVTAEVDLKGVEKVLKELPGVFEKAIKLIPSEKPENYNDKFDEMLEQLRSIDTASRMKPQAPNTVKVTNVDGTSVGVSSTVTTRYDVQGTTAYTAEAVVGTSDSSSAWTVTKFDLSDMTNASGKVATAVTWTGRAGHSYA